MVALNSIVKTMSCLHPACSAETFIILVLVLSASASALHLARERGGQKYARKLCHDHSRPANSADRPTDLDFGRSIDSCLSRKLFLWLNNHRHHLCISDDSGVHSPYFKDRSTHRQYVTYCQYARSCARVDAIWNIYLEGSGVPSRNSPISNPRASRLQSSPL